MTKALFILTSTSEFPADGGPAAGRKTGYYIDEMAAPWAALTDAGVDITFASIKGGEAPIDPNSMEDDGDNPEPVQRVLGDPDVMAQLKATLPVDSIDPTSFDLIFLPGGHGTMFDFRQTPALADVIGKAWDNGAVVGAVCHGPSGLIEARDASGDPIVKGRKVSGFTDSEEDAAGLTDSVPYLLEQELRAKGALFEKGDDFTSHAVRDGRLVTGQNPTSSEAVAKLLVAALEARSADRAA
ncbi:type 1 glutamine amidotransferase domain-containing protein [Jannaschia pohangensis]|uniref:Putative intracellular protease/amidase n=1 Tax=Jannaschia pohangensis TaxID=390807 RepID=A0A1I3IKZ1_9RHOB|nr:type 1 glutamine amidotransferase domain-containing protein [Jannaschia pohangensis]SFI48606.1 Putative intracellular protease/amidase [Jannaschia pohangensis]